MISFNEVKNKMEAMGYYATDELLYDTYNALALFNNSSVNPGQDIFAVCLEGPPGAGKTAFAKRNGHGRIRQDRDGLPGGHCQPGTGMFQTGKQPCEYSGADAGSRYPNF